MNNYTAIYIDSWMSGSHSHSLTKMRRFQTLEGESVLDALRREEIENETVFIFKGWPLLEGETEEEVNREISS